MQNIKNIIFIVALCSCFVMIFIEQSGISVILSAVQQTLYLSNSTALWVVNSYLLTMSLLLLLSGTFSDRFGHRFIFMLGIVVFLIASVICAIATTGTALITGRVIQGVGASLMMPCVSVLIKKNFPDHQFGKVLGIILGCSNFFFAMGPFIAGVITEYLNWHYFFWINIPIGLVALVSALSVIKKEIPAKSKHFSDIKGLVFYSAGLFLFIFALMQGTNIGWENPWNLGLILIGLILLLLFVVIEIKHSNGILDINLFRVKEFTGSTIILFLASMVMGSMVVWVIWMQHALGYSPMFIGIAMLPATVATIFLPPIAGAWRDRVGPYPPIMFGSILLFVGMSWIAFFCLQQNYVLLLPGFLAVGIALPLTIPICAATIVSASPVEKQGMASGLFSLVREIGMLIGIALISAIMSHVDSEKIATLLNSSSAYAGLNVDQVELILAGSNNTFNLATTDFNLLKNTAINIDTDAFAWGIGVIAALSILAFWAARKHLKLK